MAKKKYTLNNSYFKNKYPNDPDTVLEIAKYQQESGELPFDYHGDNWVYDAMCERQKRKGVVFQQFLTPDITAEHLVYTASNYASTASVVLDACCGTGQLAKHLIEQGFNVDGFDIDAEMVELCELLYPGQTFFKQDYREPKNESKYQLVVSNPPYDAQDLTAFFTYLYGVLDCNGVAVLLLPLGFLDKSRPAALVKALNQFGILERKKMEEKFERTGIIAEIVVLKKI